MTELKKQFIADALSEITDEFVAEAVEYQKPKRIWKYTRELAAVAACAAVLLVSLNAIRMIPIGNRQETASEAVTEMMPEAATLESVTITSTVTGTSETIPEEESGAEEKEATQDVCGYPTLETMQTQSCVVRLSAEEILAKNVDIFMGTVTAMETYHVTSGMEQYFTVATVEVEDSIRSELAVGESCRIYLPFAKTDGLTATTSIIGDLEKLEIGSRAIFMPYKASEETYDYYFSEGMRFLFLETENGISYATDVYEIESGVEASLEDVAAYLREMLEQ